MLQKVSEAAATLSKSMLVARQKVVGFKMVDQLVSDYSFENLYEVGCQRYWSVIRRIRSVPLLKDRSDDSSL